jgi:hypothetical protein
MIRDIVWDSFSRYKNVSRGFRSISRFCAGDFDSLQSLPALFNPHSPDDAIICNVDTAIQVT